MITEIIPALLDGLKMTLLLFFIILIISIPLGFLVALARVYAPKFISFLFKFIFILCVGHPCCSN